MICCSTKGENHLLDDPRRSEQVRIPTRQQFGYPPFGRMIRLIIQGPVEGIAEGFAEQLSDRLTTSIAQSPATVRLLGPAAAPIAKLRGKFRFHLLLHAGDGGALRGLAAAVTQNMIIRAMLCCC